MEGSLREVIGNQLILTSLPPISKVTYNISDETYVKHFSMSNQI